MRLRVERPFVNPFDDKWYVLEDVIKIMPCGHYEIKDWKKNVWMKEEFSGNVWVNVSWLIIPLYVIYVSLLSSSVEAADVANF